MQLRIKGFAQGHSSSSLIDLGFELTTVWAVIQDFNH